VTSPELSTTKYNTIKKAITAKGQSLRSTPAKSALAIGFGIAVTKRPRAGMTPVRMIKTAQHKIAPTAS